MPLVICTLVLTFLRYQLGPEKCEIQSDQSKLQRWRENATD